MAAAAVPPGSTLKETYAAAEQARDAALQAEADARQRRGRDQDPAQGAGPLRLREQRLALPDGPGVYLFKNADDQVIYVGKAISLRKRPKARSIAVISP